VKVRSVLKVLKAHRDRRATPGILAQLALRAPKAFKVRQGMTVPPELRVLKVSKGFRAFKAPQDLV
jgi:hypothetical protein